MSEYQGVGRWMLASGLGLVGRSGVSYLALDSRDLTWNVFVIGLLAVLSGVVYLTGVKDWLDALTGVARWILIAFVVAMIAGSGVANLIWPSYHGWWYAQIAACIPLTLVLLAPVHDEDERKAPAGFGGGFEGPFGPP
jgi:hypothetical protein